MARPARKFDSTDQSILNVVQPLPRKEKVKILEFARAVREIDLKDLVVRSRRDAEERGLGASDVPRVIEEVRARRRR